MIPFYERSLWKKGYCLVAGVDEAGRGPLAGPIIAAAVIYPQGLIIPGLNDSKKLTPQKRNQLFHKIKQKGLIFGIGKISSRMIDKLKIEQANLLAMKKAIENLQVAPDYLLIDGKRNAIDIPIPQKRIIGGDSKCPSIAAASIVAKVTRDRIMQRYHIKYEGYGFNRHKGYGTREHLKKLMELGPSPIHRRSFAPVAQS